MKTSPEVRFSLAESSKVHIRIGQETLHSWSLSPVQVQQHEYISLQYATQNREELENVHLIKTVRLFNVQVILKFMQEADEQIRNIKKRFGRVQRSECHFFDLSHVFTDSDNYLMFDRDLLLSYVDDETHFTRLWMISFGVCSTFTVFHMNHVFFVIGLFLSYCTCFRKPFSDKVLTKDALMLVDYTISSFVGW